MASLGAVMAGAIASAVKNAASAAKNNSSKGSGSNKSGSSSGSGGSSSGGGSSGSYQPIGTWNDQGLKDTDPGAYNQLQDYKNQYDDAVARGDTAGAQAAHDAAETLRREYGYIGGTDGIQYIPTGGGPKTVSSSIGQQADYGDMYGKGWEQYLDYMEQAKTQQQAAIQAGVDSAVADLNAQRGEVGKLTAQNNAAAEQAYMQAIKPNGSLAESLAANGLLSTGATESSQIAAGNSYQNALNSNATTEAEAIAEIERAITQAQLSGDLTAAQALSDMLTQIAEKGYQNVQDIIAANQWQQQFDYDKAVTDAGLTGVYNGQTTMQGQAAQDEHTLSQLSAESQRIANEISAKTGLTLAQLQIEALRLQNEGYTLDNAYKALQNKYANYQLGGM